MNPSIKTLCEIAGKPSRNIIGLMSGTSLDGLDIALCEISGSGTGTDVILKKFTTLPYDLKIKKRLKAISSVPKASLEEVCLLHSRLGNYHAELILGALDVWDIKSAEIDCIASHGQTIYHAPRIQHGQAEMPNATLQIGDGDHLAHATGILTISDFRQKHTAAGGEGAPMVSVVDRILYTDDTEERILLNIGGIANYTYLPPRSNERKTVTADTGPGNILIDAAARQSFSKEFDKDGAIARQGTVDNRALKALKSASYFQEAAPKTTGAETFNPEWVNTQLQKAGINNISPEDMIATLTRLTAETIADAVNNIPNTNQPTVYASGGGIHNPVLIEWIRELLPGIEIKNFNTLGFNPDAKEAVLFAVLANEMLAGNGFFIGSESPSNQKINFGKISFPS